MTDGTFVNLQRSLWTRLVNGAKRRGEEPSLTLLRYASERFLHRLSVSPYRDRFVLKGAMLFAAWAKKPHRSTKDVDLLGFGAPDDLVRVFTEICALDFEAVDGVRFDPSGIRAEHIREDEEYDGRRVCLTGTFGKMPVSVQVDVGFGDIVTPGPVELTYPTLLEQLPGPQLKSYPVETVIAEKFEAMVKLGLANSRMKDFYDVWVLSRLRAFELSQLATAAHETFRRRGTAWPSEDPFALTRAFSDDPAKRTQWDAFLRRSRAEEKPSLEDVVGRLRRFLSETYSVSSGRHRQWSPDQGVWRTNSGGSA